MRYGARKEAKSPDLNNPLGPERSVSVAPTVPPQKKFSCMGEEANGNGKRVPYATAFGDGERLVEPWTQIPRVSYARQGTSKYGLHELVVGQNSLKLKATVPAARYAVRHYRERHDSKAKFVIRAIAGEPGWIRIWRTK